MAETFEIKLSGFDALQKILSEVPPDIAKKAGIDALKLAARPILEEAQNLVPEGATGKLADSLEIAVKKAAIPVVKVQASRKKGGYHAHLVELGTQPHDIRNVVIGDKFYPVIHHPGSKKKPFLRPAFNAKKADALKITLSEIMVKITGRLKRELK